MQCMPAHEGPFFFEASGVNRCEACRGLVTFDQVRDSARELQRGRDGNELQKSESAERIGLFP